MAYPSDLVRTKNWGTEVLTDSDLEGQFDLIINWVMAALNSSTGHSHSGSGNNGPRLASSAVTTTFGNGFTTVTGESSDYLLIAADVSDSNTTKKALASDFVYVPSASNALAGSVVQIANTQTGAVATGTTVMVDDDSIPQNTEGDEYMTLAVTPTNASNILYIDVVAVISNSSSSAGTLMCALFQDSTANALAASAEAYDTNSDTRPRTMTFRHKMTAGTTSATTFKVRAGFDAAGTTTFNGQSGSRILGGVLASSITITEIKV